jgi:hypothetical protein
MMEEQEVKMICFMPLLAMAFAFAPANSDDHAEPKGSTTEPIVNYFPPPESQGGWRKLDNPNDIRKFAGMDPAKLNELKNWLLKWIFDEGKTMWMVFAGRPSDPYYSFNLVKIELKVR